MPRVTWSWFEQKCRVPVCQLAPRQAYEMAVTLQSIAPWWLNSDVLRLANDHACRLFGRGDALWALPPRLANHLGVCGVIVTSSCNRSSNGLCLRDAFVIPLQWCRGQPHDNRLPENLLSLAERLESLIRADFLRNRSGSSQASWGLRFADDKWPEIVDFHSIDATFDSAAVPLAAALFSAFLGIHCHTTVWASGAWTDEGGVQVVDGLKEKMQCAQDLRGEVFFVPAQQLREAEALQAQLANSTHLEICPLAVSSRIYDALRPLLARLWLPPGHDQSRDARVNYFLHVHDEQDARHYYRTCILTEVVDQARRWLPTEHKYRFSHFVTIVSQGYDLPLLLAWIFQPQHVLLLHDAGMKQRAWELLEHFQSLHFPGRVTAAEFSGLERHRLLDQFQRTLAKFLEGYESERLLVDITSGMTLQKLALYDSLPRGAWAVCCQTQQDRLSRRPIPLTERYELWQV